MCIYLRGLISQEQGDATEQFSPNVDEFQYLPVIFDMELYKESANVTANSINSYIYSNLRF